MRTGRALRQFPFVAEQVPEEVAAPLRGRGGPGDLQAAADRVTPLPVPKLLFQPNLAPRCRPLRFGPTWDAGPAPWVLPKVWRRQSARGFFVVHRHATERLADIPGRGDRIRVAVRAFRVDVNQTICTAASGFSRSARRSSVCHPAKWSRNPSRRPLPAPIHPPPAGETERLESIDSRATLPARIMRSP